MSKFHRLIVGIIFVFLALSLVSCSSTETIDEKIDSLLLLQVNLRMEQIAEPTPERLEMMKQLGMNVDDLEIQRIFIHLSQELSTSQMEEVQSMGIMLYTESWIPPVGVHPTGFIIADMPVDKLEELAAKDYVVRLETAERVLEPDISQTQR